MSSPELPDAIPFWTAKMYPPGGGLDHLGLGSVVTDRILPRLAPGINVLTVHPRYWSFYAFVLSEFWSRDLPRTKAALRAWYRPLECIYSVACALCDGPDHRGSPIGIRRIGALVAGERDGFDPRFDYMDSPMGGYGLYYATVMQSVGLAVLADRRLGLPVDAVTPDGQVVAEAFRSVVAGTEYYEHWIDRHDETVPRDVVAEYGRRACFCRLREPAATDRSLLVDAFLHMGNPAEAEARRGTLRFMCELSAQSVAAPVDEASFRRLVYFGADHACDDAGASTFIPTDSILRTARRWRLYQARDYFNVSIHQMWRRLIEWGIEREGDRVPVPMAAVRASLADIDFASFAPAIGVGLPAGGLSADASYTEFLEWGANAGAVTGGLDDRWDLRAQLTEDAIVACLEDRRCLTKAGPDRLAAALTLVTLVAARLWRAELAMEAGEDWFPVIAGGTERLGIQSFLSELRDRADGGATVAEIADWLTRDYVIAQHERVATAKLSTTGDTFRFRREAGRLRFFSKGAEVRRNDSRFDALATFLFELGWSGYLEEADHDLSEEGEEMRLAGDLQPTGAFNSSSPEDR